MSVDSLPGLARTAAKSCVKSPLPLVEEKRKYAGQRRRPHTRRETHEHARSPHAARTEPNRIPRWILIVEGWGDKYDFSRNCQEVLSNDILVSAGTIGPADVGLYQLQATTTRADLEANSVR